MACGSAAASCSLTAVTNAAEAANSEPAVAARTAKGRAALANVVEAAEEEVAAYPRDAEAAAEATLVPVSAARRWRGSAARPEAAPPAPMTRRPSWRAAERMVSFGGGGRLRNASRDLD